jgi:hypothetical protein
MRRYLAAALLAIAGGLAHAAPASCDVVDAPDSITIKCPKASTPVPVPVVPVVPCGAGGSAAAAPILSTRRARRGSRVDLRHAAGQSGRAIHAGDPGSGDRSGFDLTPGSPKINVLAAAAYAFRFTAPRAGVYTVGYGVAAGTDSGMRVESWLTRSDGAVILDHETRVVGNWQPFPQLLEAGSYTFFVKPAAAGPLMVELQ